MYGYDKYEGDDQFDFNQVINMDMGIKVTNWSRTKEGEMLPPKEYFIEKFDFESWYENLLEDCNRFDMVAKLQYIDMDCDKYKVVVYEGDIIQDIFEVEEMAESVYRKEDYLRCTPEW